MKSSRRNFLKSAAVTAAFTTAMPRLFAEIIASENNSKKVRLKEGATILFQGDSITDGSRKKEDTAFNTAAALGTGYPFIVAADLLHQLPEKKLKIYNRGISGNKVPDLAARWLSDTINIKPDVLSIHIGVNDYWHTLLGKYSGTIKDFRDGYFKLIEDTQQALPDVQLLIGEPFGVNGIKHVTDKWYPAYDEFRSVAREVSDHFKAVFIPYQKIFDKALAAADGNYWTTDGVHPTIAGSHMMAEAWLATLIKK